LIERDREYIASLETADNGQPYSGIFNNDMGFIIDVFKYYAGWCDKIQGRTMQIGMQTMPFLQPNNYQCYGNQVEKMARLPTLAGSRLAWSAASFRGTSP
jgi:Aldehyde dehydrogenase family